MEAGYTADDLIAAAIKAGHPELSARTITDWVQKGLLDQPARRSKGRNKGSDKALFPENQRDLLLLILDKRGDSSGIAHLLRIPIAIWLYWGDDYVPTRQALRALTEWARRHQTSSQARARDGVDGLIAQIAHPDAGDTARRGLERTLMQAATARTVPTDLHDRIKAVVDPHGTGRVLGLPGIPVQPEAQVGAWIGQRRAIAQLLAKQVKAVDMEKARAELRQTLAEYQAIQPYLALAIPSDPLEAVKASPLELERLVQNAATDLLLPLAAVLAKGHQ